MNEIQALFNFEGYLQDIYYNTHETDIQKARGLLAKFDPLSQFDINPMPHYFILDYTRGEYDLFSDNSRQIAGYHPRDFLDAGIDMLRHVFVKDDFHIFGKEIFPRNCSFLKTIPQNEHGNYVFSYSFRVLDATGREVYILQQGSYITSPETGLPLYSLGTCTDVSDLKSDSRMLHSIKKISGDENMFQNETVIQNFFYPNEEDTLFTNKEKEVLCHLVEGLCTKQIADNMKVAESTIVTHRTNMMQKTNTKNAVELVAYSIRKHII